MKEKFEGILQWISVEIDRRENHHMFPAYCMEAEVNMLRKVREQILGALEL